MTRITEIRARLEASTKAPQLETHYLLNRATLIANAHADLAFLLGRVAELEGLLREARATDWNRVSDIAERIDEAIDEAVRL